MRIPPIPIYNDIYLLRAPKKDVFKNNKNLVDFFLGVFMENFCAKKIEYLKTFNLCKGGGSSILYKKIMINYR